VPPAPPIAIPYGAEVISAVLANERREAEAIEKVFLRMTAGQPVVAEWRSVKAQHADLGEIVMQHGRCADLIVASQADPDWDLSVVLDFPERLALESGRPVLVVPYIGRYAVVGRNAMIAWKASRESARAVFDAVPLLEGADKITILEIEERGKKSEGGLAPDTQIAAALARHGFKPTVQRTVAGDIGVGDEILSRLADAGVDLLVMGAYGHSRFREIVFGGVTRHIARHMTVPVLFSH
jgi:nucleotide-binding universal stress UspA family protein